MAWRGVALLLALTGILAAAPISWEFNPPRAARALLSGGWTAEYPLGTVNASPEFSFTLQLVYMTTRDQNGLFGNGWFCPQLESSVLPLGKGYLLWTMPTGGQVLLEEDPGRGTRFRSRDGLWNAEVTPSKQKIINPDGWEYLYSKGKLIAVISPTKRALEFEWDKTRLMGIQLRDIVSNRRRLILIAAYGENKRLSGFKLDGQSHRFAYLEDGTRDRLNAWDPPVGETMRFLYHPETTVLLRAGIGNTNDPERVEEFKTRYVDPRKSAAPTLAEEFAAKKKAANYCLAADRNLIYHYGVRMVDKKALDDPSSVTVTNRAGLAQKTVYSEKRGIVTSQQGGAERKSYYYRAPGQKYDGKLRRIEENGTLTQEYRYDRKTGLLTEIIDSTGVSSFFDYDPDYRPRAGHDSPEPKPLRVRRGNRRKSEVTAEYAYSDDGKLLAAKDAHGNLTRYTYTTRGEISSITHPAGDKVEYSYDDFGRMTTVSSAGRTESVEYDDSGRVKLRTAADGTRTEMSYDPEGHLTQLKRNGKVTTELIRDELHRVIGEKDSLMRLSRLERDVRGNLTARIAPNGSVTRYEYDESDRRIAQIDGNGNRIGFEYDPAGHLVKQTNALGNTQTWKYDTKTGKLLERANGEQIIRHTYFPDGNLKSIDYGNGESLAYDYDKDGRPTSASGPDSLFETTYDPEGRPLATRAACGMEDYLLGYRHNLRGQRAGLLISKLVEPPAGPARYEVIQQTEQLYDPSGRLSAILTNGIPAISYHYDSIGRPIRKTYGTPERGRPALTVDIGYDSVGHLGHMTFQGGRLTSPLELIYEWDAADQLTRRTWNARTLRYEYDPSGQLLNVIDDHDQSLLEAYTYDPAGNMLTKLLDGQLTAMSYNAGNQLVASHELGSATPQTAASLPGPGEGLENLAKTSLSHHYDRAGRMLGSGSQPPRTYGWLDKVIAVPLQEGGKAAHLYWPDGQLAEISPINVPALMPVPPTETFLWDGLALIKRNDIIYLIEPHPSGGVPIASHPVGKPGEITYHLNDLLGTTLATAGPAGVKFTSLTSFGQNLKASTAGSNSPSAPSAPANPVPTTNQLPPTRQ